MFAKEENKQIITIMQKGNIGITTENIFPVIKKFLYSEHDIFLREVVANAVDATQKLKTLSAKGDFKGELGDLTVRINLNKEAGTLTISDKGVGMDAEEIDKYINQIAFSGATEFLDKYKDDANAIIGHFGLGFYSTFMVSKQVEIVTRSYKEDAQAVRWICDGTPSYEISEAEKEERGTDIILHIDDDCKQFLEKGEILRLLGKYCRFLPIPIACGKKTEWKDGKQVDTEEDNIVNVVDPLWMKQPASLKEEDYKKFYHDLYPTNDDPLFWIHLNVDFPFHLTGVLYFPKIKSNLDVRRNQIQLYCNQVYVTDQVENIVPDFLTLLHGVIDSPDIPLNVSRSYLQSDANVKKISSYITKKVSDRLNQIFKHDRKDFEEKWDDLKLFIHYGMLAENDFYDRVKDFALLKDTEGKYFTYEEYKQLITENQTDKNGQLIYLYATNLEEQYSYIEAARNKGYSILLMDGQLDTPLVQMLEQKFEKSSFLRVDGDTINKLIQKDDAETTKLSADENENICEVFSALLPKIEKTEIQIATEAMGEDASPVVITQSEYMRRMREMSAMQPGMSFYGEMPDSYNLVLNTDHALIQSVLADEEKACAEKLQPVRNDIKGWEARQSDLREAQNKKKEDEITASEKEDLTNTNRKLTELRGQQNAILAEYAAGNPIIGQLIDLALLGNGLLKGEALSRFIRRSVDLIR